MALGELPDNEKEFGTFFYGFCRLTGEVLWQDGTCEEMPPERLTHPHGRFKMDDVSGPECPQRRPLEGLRNGFEGEDTSGILNLRSF